MARASPQANKPVFTDEYGNPICVFLDYSIRRASQIRQLREEIENNGGTVLDTDEGADTVLALLGDAGRNGRQLTYGCSQVPGRNQTWVEHPSWVRLCIGAGECFHRQKQRKGMGGGSQRHAFTPEEEEKLCQYLARRIPDERAGGRRGYGVYEDLASMGRASQEDDEFWWIRNHSWQSWRNRFNKNYKRLNRRVNEIASRLQPAETDPYYLDRRLNRRKPAIDFSDNEEEEEGSNDEDDDERVLGPPVAGPSQQRLDAGEEHQDVREPGPERRRRQRSRWAEPEEREESGDEMARAAPRSRSRSLPLSDQEDPLAYLFDELEEEEAMNSQDLEVSIAEALGLDSTDDTDDMEAMAELEQQLVPYGGRLITMKEYMAALDLFSAQPDPFLPPPTQGFFSSQRTLIGQPASPQKRIPSSVSRHRRTSEQHPAATKPVVAPALPSLPPISQPSPLQRREKSSPIARRPSPPLSEPEEPPAEVAPARRAAKKLPQEPPSKPTTRKRKAPSTPPANAPSRNTRARSASVEPLELPARKRKKRSDLQPLVEAPQEPPQEARIEDWDEVYDKEFESQEPLPEIIPPDEVISVATSNQVDELDVQDQLVPGTTISHASEEPQEEVHAQEQEQGQTESTLDTDDAQIDEKLRNPRQPDEKTSQFPPSIFEPVDNVLAILEASRRNTMNPSQPNGSGRIPQPFFHSSTPGSRRVSGPAAAMSSPAAVDLQVVTPRRQLSSSSEDTFPIPGTRASAIKERIQEREKSTPYRPPPGTKAAQIREREEEAQKATQKRALRPRKK